MCGGIKKTIRDSMSRLDQGISYSWPLSSGDRDYIFGGHARIENLDKIWVGVEHVKIIAEEFSERNTKEHKFSEFKPFPVPQGKAIHAIIDNNNELRIVTEPATGNVAQVHNRMPNLVEI